jgi:hypothetical protein
VISRTLYIVVIVEKMFGEREVSLLYFSSDKQRDLAGCDISPQYLQRIGAEYAETDPYQLILNLYLFTIFSCH